MKIARIKTTTNNINNLKLHNFDAWARLLTLEAGRPDTQKLSVRGGTRTGFQAFIAVKQHVSGYLEGKMKGSIANLQIRWSRRAVHFWLCALVALCPLGLPQAHGADPIEPARAALLNGDFALAVELAEAASGSDEAGSLLVSGLAYFLEYSPLHDLSKGLERLDRASDLGSAEASLILGTHYFDFEDEENLRASKVYYFRAKNRFPGEHASAHAFLSIYFRNNAKVAIEYANTAYEHDMPLSSLQLATLYLLGLGFAQDNDRAEFYMRQDAEKGYPMAQFLLGGMLTDGACFHEGQVPDATAKQAEGMRWLVLARSQGTEEAAELLENCAEVFGQASLSQVSVEANRWFGKIKDNPSSLLHKATKWCADLKVDKRKCEYASVDDDNECLVFVDAIFQDDKLRQSRLYHHCRRSLWLERAKQSLKIK